jgi:hypothetical protein
MRIVRLSVLCAVAATLMMVVGPATAGAHKKKWERHTTVEFQDLPGSSGDRLSGVLSFGPEPEEPFFSAGPPAHAAAAANCIAGARVLIHHHAFQAAIDRSAGKSQISQYPVVATATTDSTGAWATTGYEASAANQLLFDQFNIEVVKTRLPPKNSRHKHVCLGAFADKTVFSY